MASRKICTARPNYIYPSTEITENPIISSSDNLFEFDEADVWNSNESATSLDFNAKKPLPSSRNSSKKFSRNMDLVNPKSSSSTSLPVSIPDWSKILKEEYRGHVKRESDEDPDPDPDDDDLDDHHHQSGGVNFRIPPHEYLARRRGDSFSVHEGIGRTLKGRDLRRVRNAIWKRTGFED